MEIGPRKTLKYILYFLTTICAGVGVLTLTIFYGAITYDVRPQFFNDIAMRYSVYYMDNYPREDLITPEYMGPIYKNITENSSSLYNKTKRVYQFVKNNIRYVDDYDLRFHNSHEYYQEPIQTLATGMADCDDFSFLIASLLRVENNLSYSVTVPNHRFTITCINNSWYRVDPSYRTYGLLSEPVERKMSIDCNNDICPVENKTKILEMC